jgi:hypothetical protein
MEEEKSQEVNLIQTAVKKVVRSKNPGRNNPDRLQSRESSECSK